MSQFSTIHTLYGLEAMAQAEAAGTPINLTHMAVGDGGGAQVSPLDTQANLVRELYRAPVNRVFQDPSMPNRFTAELVIPVSQGGFVLREVGIFDANGSLFAVGNLPETYKPTIEEGAFADTVVRMDFLVSNVGVVAIQIDPNVAVATQTWISNNITAAALIPGGTTNQVLAKNSNIDGDTKWVDPDVANVVVDCIEERQKLSAGQTNVILSLVTTRGLAVYVDGKRLPNAPGAGGWQSSVADPDTTVILGQAYAAGTTILLTQNEPTGSVPYPLVRDLNLSDVPDKALGRQNLGVHSKDESNASGQAGDIKYTARTSSPSGWLKANGAAISRIAYADLFAAIGTTFGTGDGFTTFNLPDLRGEFLRGLDDGRGVDAGRTLGSTQGSQNLAHAHGVNDQGHSHGVNDAGHSHGINDPGHSHTYVSPKGQSGTNAGGPIYINYNDVTGTSATGITIRSAGTGISIAGSGTGISVQNSGGNESRPRNIALLACIKY